MIVYLYKKHTENTNFALLDFDIMRFVEIQSRPNTLDLICTMYIIYYIDIHTYIYVLKLICLERIRNNLR